MVLLGLCDICGYYSQLEQGLLKAGVPCTLVNAFPSIRYERQTRPKWWLGRVVESIAARRVAAAPGSMARALLTAWQAVWMFALFLRTIGECRTYVFAGGTSFFGPVDLWLLKKLGKRIVIVFHGTDARAPYVNGAFPCETPAEIKACIAEAARMKARIAGIERHADVIVNHVLSSHFHERPIVGWLNVGIPSDVGGIAPTPPSTSGPCVIVHAPTRPGPKGSAIFEKAIDNLKAKGHQIEFIKLVGKTNAQVLDAIRGCDFVVDELFSDITMASFATEAATFGKAAVVGLHGYELLEKWTAPGLLPPAVLCEPATAERVIEQLVIDRQARLERGRQAREFLEQRWTSEGVSQRFKQLCDGMVPSSWYFDPASVPYVFGWGLSDEQARRRIAAVIAAGGVEALQLRDKPEVERAFVEFAAGRG